MRISSRKELLVDRQCIIARRIDTRGSQSRGQCGFWKIDFHRETYLHTQTRASGRPTYAHTCTGATMSKKSGHSCTRGNAHDPTAANRSRCLDCSEPLRYPLSTGRDCRFSTEGNPLIATLSDLTGAKIETPRLQKIDHRSRLAMREIPECCWD